MDVDWTLIEYRPGRYARVSSDGTFLGVASDEEVRAWFASMGRPARRQPDRQPPSTARTQPAPAGGGRPAPEPEVPWEKPLIWGRKPPPARREGSARLEHEPDVAWAKPMLWGRPPDSPASWLEHPEPPPREPAGVDIAPEAAPVELEGGGASQAAARAPQPAVEPGLPQRFLTLDLRKPEPEPGGPSGVSIPDASALTRPGEVSIPDASAVAHPSRVSIPSANGVAHPEEPPALDHPTGASIPGANGVAHPEEPPALDQPTGASIPDANGVAHPEEQPPPDAPGAVSIPDANGFARPKGRQGESLRSSRRPRREMVQVTMELPGLEADSPRTPEKEAGGAEVGWVAEEPAEPLSEPELELAPVEAAGPEPMVDGAEPDALQAAPDELEEALEASAPGLPLLDDGEPWPEEELFEDEDTGSFVDFEPSATLPTRRRKPVVPEASDAGDDGQEADAPDTENLWLWVDPRYEGGYNPAKFDLAGFLQRAIVLFQSKPWAGGNRPGRIAVHSGRTDESLGPVAERLGLTVVEDERVSDGTYWLGLETNE